MLRPLRVDHGHLVDGLGAGCDRAKVALGNPLGLFPSDRRCKRNPEEQTSGGEELRDRLSPGCSAVARPHNFWHVRSGPSTRMKRLAIAAWFIVACGGSGAATGGGTSSGDASSPEAGGASADGSTSSAGTGGAPAGDGNSTSSGGTIAAGGGLISTGGVIGTGDSSSNAGGNAGVGGLATSTGGSRDAGGATSTGGSRDSGGAAPVDGSIVTGTSVHGCYECNATTDCSALCGDMGGACPARNCGSCSPTTGCCACSVTATGADCSATTCPPAMLCVDRQFLGPGCVSGSCANTAQCAQYSLSQCCLGSPRLFSGKNFGYCANSCP